MGKTSEQLRTETAQLVAALRAPQTRGAWGEHQLRQVVEFAGMIEHCDFTEQTSISTDAGLLRPDLVVRLAGGKHVVVDAKVSLIGFLDAMGADEPARGEHLKRHARHLRDHIDSLGAKAYWDLLPNTPEFVVMFVPAETFLNAALETDPSLLQRAFEKNVVIATPATLVALLRTVGYSWRQEALATNAHEVLNLGRELYSRLSTMGGHVDKLGRSLTAAVSSYNNTVSSLESRVFTTARKLVDLKVTDDDLEAPRQIELVARQVQKSELVASAYDMLISLPESDEPIDELHAAG
jgi:DNA recombination protein RmuC